MIQAMRQLPPRASYQPKDILVVFGELFSRGYANGVVEQAKAQGLEVIYSTVGRREGGGELRPLNPAELAELPKPLINVPLEAGFDLETSSQGLTPVDQLKGIRMDQWAEARLDWEQIHQSAAQGKERFRRHLNLYLKELEQMIPVGRNVIFLHTMAGGVPRAKIYMPTMNKIFKGRGERYESSLRFTESDMGRFALMNFDEVTADTFAALIEMSEPLRRRLQSLGGRVSYQAYGYHGCEVLVGDHYRWQTYTCYFQAWAKLRLERWAREAHAQGIRAAVYNCPEILTNSSSIFQGVEVSLYPLLGALAKEGATHPSTQSTIQQCQALLKDGQSLDEMLKFTANYLNSPLMQKVSDFAHWPQHNSPEQMELMLSSSDTLIDMHRDPKKLITALLSEEVFKASGALMFHDSWSMTEPVWWLGHDIIARQLAGELAGTRDQR